jgi:hypothetical protein
MNAYVRYACATCVYAIARKVRHLHDAQLASWEDSKPATRPMLATEKIVVLGASALYSPILAPCWLFKDANLLEIHLRKENVEKYGYDRADRMTLIEHIIV